MDHAETRYLDAKRTVDDRALNRRVRDAMLDCVPDRPDVLEAGPGTGATLPRLVDWGITAGTYLGIDRSVEAIAHARRERAAELDATPTDDGFRVGDLTVAFEQGDAFAAFGTDAGDLLIAQAVLDLVPLGEALDAAERALRPGGLLYAPITFDGVSLFQPDHPDDEAVTAAYHEHIASLPGRDPAAGRHLIGRLCRREGDLLAAGASDWVVRPRDSDYPGDERYFLSRVLEFVENGVDAGIAGDWLETRRRQLAEGRLTYVAHQYDLLYRTPGE
ncbi:MAG: class I SAM-dependent methyltransferase [Salinirussus sp.]